MLPHNQNPVVLLFNQSVIVLSTIRNNNRPIAMHVFMFLITIYFIEHVVHIICLSVTFEW